MRYLVKSAVPPIGFETLQVAARVSPGAHAKQTKVFASFFKKKCFFEKKNQKTFASPEAHGRPGVLRLAGFIVAILLVAGAARAGTIADRVLAAGRLRCGVITEPLDWNKDDLHGSLAALDAEMCRAISTALFAVPDRFDLKSYSSERDGLAALQRGEADIVAGVTPNSISAGQYGVRFSQPFFQDPQSFMVHRAEGIHTLADIAGHKLCFIDGTDNGYTVLSALTAAGVKPVPFPFEEEGEMDAAIMDRHCQVTSALASKLAEARGTFRNSKEYLLLPQSLALTPATIAVDAGDARLAGIVDYTISALLQAEFLGVTHANAGTLPASEDPRFKRLLGQDWSTGQGLGLPHAWSRMLIATVGNYGEIYDRTVGPGTLFNLPRGVNALWSQGGVMAPLPLQ
jgi:general L-amino acid transport system substrate-binding protein